MVETKNPKHHGLPDAHGDAFLKPVSPSSSAGPPILVPRLLRPLRPSAIRSSCLPQDKPRTPSSGTQSGFTSTSRAEDTGPCPTPGSMNPLSYSPFPPLWITLRTYHEGAWTSLALTHSLSTPRVRSTSSPTGGSLHACTLRSPCLTGALEDGAEGGYPMRDASLTCPPQARARTRRRRREPPTLSLYQSPSAPSSNPQPASHPPSPSRHDPGPTGPGRSYPSLSND